MSATLTVTREVGFGIELRRGRFDVCVDGNTLGTLDDHVTMEWPLEAGTHTIQVRAGRYSSGDHAFEVADCEGISFRCHGIRIWPMYVASIVKPDLAIALKRA